MKSYGESKKYFKFGYSWFIRRKNSFDYLFEISKYKYKYKYKYKLNFDYFFTLVFSKILKYL